MRGLGGGGRKHRGNQVPENALAFIRDHVVRNYSTGLGIASLMRLWIATAANADGGAPG
ncbi:MAG: hypothetical protein ACLPWS_17475 [Rhodomicrobium sp.]